MKCEICDVKLKQSNQHIKYCSNTCRNKAHYSHNKERRAEQLRTKAREWWREHSKERNLKRRLVSQDKYRINREKEIKKSKDSYYKHIDKKLKNQKDYYTYNKERLNSMSKIRNKTKKILGYPSSCSLCGNTKDLEWHHFSYNKKDSWRDCVGVCRVVCHDKLDKERRIVEKVLGCK
jgi:hypothetical protein